MTALEVMVTLAAGLVAGAINTIVGSGSLITFPVLLALGYPPVTANVTNCVGLVPGSFSGAFGYRSLLAGRWGTVIRLGGFAIGGGLVGALALLVLPQDVFKAVVVVLIAFAAAVMVFQPRINLWMAGRRPARRGGGLVIGVFLTAVYGGYFGAAHGVILISVLSIFMPDGLQTINAFKNMLGSMVNVVAALVFILVAEVAWGPAAALAVGTLAGGYLGALVGRRIPPWILRMFVVVVGLTAIGVLLL